jgi:redox-sensitive bicupin YhaK (pirin superfamily)
MSTTAQARIYLSSQRGITQTEGLTSLHTFNFGDYAAEGRVALERLCAFNHHTLEAGNKTHIQIDTVTEIILLPILGGLELIDHHQKSFFAASGEHIRLVATPEKPVIILNPYETETIQYLEIHFKAESGALLSNQITEHMAVNSFSLQENRISETTFSTLDQLISGSIGQYAGRQDDLYKLKNQRDNLFVYIIRGAFEVEDRLLENGDALALNQVKSVKFEALSQGAIILLIEV